MSKMTNMPLLVFAVCLTVFWLAAQAGSLRRRHVRQLHEEDRTDLGVIVAASLTLLGLIIGFTFSMAVTRYDQRKNYEAAEANAIGTEYARAGLLPAAEAAKVRGLLTNYLTQRIQFYTTRDSHQLEKINAAKQQLQNELWSIVQNRAAQQPTPIVALAVSGMNDVLNSEAYTQAAWWNRIPTGAWILMSAIGICCSYLVGFSARPTEVRLRRFFVLPLLISISLFLIADIDSPRGGVILVHPQNLESFAASTSHN